MKRHIILISLFLFTALFSVAQNSGCTIKGVVREYDLDMQKNPLDGVQVQIAVDGNRSDITKDGGKFAIEDVPYCHPGDKISTDKNSFTKPGYELFYPDALNFWYVPNVTINSSTEILMCKSSRIYQVRQKLFNVVDQYHKKLYEQKKDELEKAHLEKQDMERQLIILEAQFRDTAQIMKMVNEWLYLDRLKCDSVLKQAYAFMENGEVDKAREIMNKHEMKSSEYYKKRMNETLDEVTQALQFVKRRLNMNFASNDMNVIPFIERDCNFLIAIYTDQLNVDDPEGFVNKEQIKKQLAAAYALKGDISELSYSKADVKEFISNYRKAAEMGNAHAQYKMGECYENVLIWRKSSYYHTDYMFNIDSARYWYASAAYQNDTNAIRRLETFYDFVAKDKNGNDIYYHILPDRKSVSVVRKTLNTTVYAGNIILPKKVKYDDKQYDITKIEDETFEHCFGLQSVTIPNSVTEIEDGAFVYTSIHTFLCETGGVYSTIEDGAMLLEKTNQGCRLVAFAPQSDIHDVAIPNSVTAIGDGAFYCCKNLQSVTIPNSVTTIGDYAFKLCDNLQSVTIPNSVTTIGDGAFFWCMNLQCVTIPNSVTIIEREAFSYCSRLQSMTIPNSVTTIGNEAFHGCSSLQSVTIPNSVTTIGHWAFHGCSSLQSVTIPNSVTTIGHWAFSDCKSLQSVTIPNSVTTIRYGGFSGCSRLQSVTIPNSVTTIGDDAFSDCSSLQSVTIPNSVTKIGNWAFLGCSSLQSVTIPNSVTTIGYSAFSDCSSLQSVTIPNSVTEIRDGTFSDCSSLQSVTIPNSVTKIGDRAFYECSSLQSVTIPNSVTMIGDWAFAYTSIHTFQCEAGGVYSTIENGAMLLEKTNKGHCLVAFAPHSDIREVTIPNSVTMIGNMAFYMCSSLQSVTIPNSVTTIGTSAFYECESLESVTIPNSMTTIENSAFGYCLSLQNVTIPNSVTAIGDEAFIGCSSLQSVTIPNSVTTIGTSAFYECESLESVTIPNSVTTIGYGAFYGCESLQSVNIPNSVTTIGKSAFENCSALQSVTIPNSVTTIGDWAFYGCQNLQSVTIPNSVTTIGDGAFYECSSLQSVTIPNSVTTIGYRAFYGCESLQSVTIPDSVEEIDEDAFSGCPFSPSK